MKEMLKQIFFIVMLAIAIIAAATLSASSQLLASGKRKKKNNSNKQIKKRNSVDHFMVINAIKKEDNDKKEAEVRILTKAAIAIAIATFKAGNIYGNDA